MEDLVVLMVALGMLVLMVALGMVVLMVALWMMVPLGIEGDGHKLTMTLKMD